MQTILVVEDEVLVAVDLELALSEAHFNVTSAQTVSTALQSISSEQPDGVVLDARLYGSWSKPVAELLSKLEIPYVIYSGTPWREIELWANPAEFLEKPKSAAIVVAAVQKAIARNNKRR